MGCLKLNNDYYPSDNYHDGMQIQERSYSTTTKGYRFAFNGMEKDNEVKGAGNSLDFGSRIYDSRLGRFLSVDAFRADMPHMSPYAYALNNPTNTIDVEGDFPLPAIIRNAVISGATEYVFQVLDNFMTDPSMEFGDAMTSVDMTDILVETGLGAASVVIDPFGTKAIRKFGKLFKGKYRKFSMYAIKQSIDIIEGSVNEALKDVMNGKEVDVYGIIGSALGEKVTSEIMNATLEKAMKGAIKRGKKKYQKHINKAVDAKKEAASLKDKLENATGKKRKKLKRKYKDAKDTYKKHKNKATKVLEKQYENLTGGEVTRALKDRAVSVTSNAINSKVGEVIAGPISGGEVVE